MLAPRVGGRSDGALEDVSTAPLVRAAGQDLRGRPADEVLVTVWGNADGIEVYAKGAIVRAVPTRIGFGDPYLAPGEASP